VKATPPSLPPERPGRRRRLFGPLSLAVTLLLASSVSTRLRSVEPAAAAQPLVFSHRIHAGQQAIPCLYCHAYARRGPVAGLPAVERCAGCHATAAAEKPDVKKLMEYWDKREPIPWLRVHDLPDFVRFNHKRHVAARVECRECHGAVESMEHAVRVSSLEMGWCLDCHRRRQASTDCLVCHY
jgi:hypothetical protein